MRMAVAGGAVFLALSGCGHDSLHHPQGECPVPWTYSADEIRGRVVDEETGQPLAGVAVAVTWELHGGFHGGHQKWLKLADTVTDENGEYYFPRWGPRRRPFFTGLWGGEPVLLLFKPRYKPTHRPNALVGCLGSVRKSSWSGRELPLRRFNGSEKEYTTAVDYFADEVSFLLFQTCDWESLPRFLGAVYRETESLRAKGLREAPELDLDWGARARKHGCHSPREVFGAVS